MAAIPGELYYYTLGSELGVLGLALWLAIALIGLVFACRVALRSTDSGASLVALAAAAMIVVILVDSFAVDAMSSAEVAAYFWLLLGMVARWHVQLLPRRTRDAATRVTRSPPPPAMTKTARGDSTSMSAPPSR